MMKRRNPRLKKVFKTNSNSCQNMLKFQICDPTTNGIWVQWWLYRWIDPGKKKRVYLLVGSSWLIGGLTGDITDGAPGGFTNG